MSIGALPSNPDLSQLNAQMTEVTADYAAAQTNLARMRADSAYTQDQISAYAQSASAMGRQILDLSAQIQGLISDIPALSPPKSQTAGEVGTNLAAMRNNGWLKPSSLVALVSAMMYVLKQEASYAAIEGQNTSKGMLKQQELGHSEAEAQRSQGKLAWKKAIVSAVLEGVSAGVQFGIVAKRTATAAGGTNSAGANRIDARAQGQIAPLQARNANLQAQIDGGPMPNGPLAGGPPVPPAQPARAQQLRAQMAANDQEIAQISSQANFQKQEMMHQELVTWEQIGRGIDHLSGAAMKLNEGFFDKNMKYLEAEITQIRTSSDILRTYMQSASRGQSEGRQAAQEIVKAIEAMVQSYARAYWARAA